MFTKLIAKTVGIPKKDFAKLAVLAKEEEVSVSYLIRLAIAIYLRKPNKKSKTTKPNEDSKN